MKTADKWQEELNGETSTESIRAIQADALLDAIAIVTRRRKTDAVITELARIAEELQPNKGGGIER